MPEQSILGPLVERVRTDVTAKKNNKGAQVWTREALTPARLAAHLSSGPARGVCPIKAGECVTRAALLDLDSHKGETPWSDMATIAVQISDVLTAQGLRVTPFASSGGAGIHLYLLWDEPQDAYSVRQALASALKRCGLAPGVKGIAKGAVEVFPKQDCVPEDGFGNQFILPLAGQSVPLEPLLGMAKLQRDTPFVWAMSDPVPVLEHPVPSPPKAVEGVEFETIQSALAAFPPPQEREPWLKTLFAIHAATDGGEDGRAIAHEWSGRDLEVYEPEEVDKIWDHAHSDRASLIGPGTLFKYALDAGWQMPATQPSPDAFDDISNEPEPPEDPPRYQFVQAAVFAHVAPLRWIIKGILPAAELGMVYGDSGSGKTFVTLDILAAIALGASWRGHKVAQGSVAYIAAEGASGVKNRLRACAAYRGHALDLAALPLHVLGDAPNFTVHKEALEVIKAAKQLGPLSVIVVDTYAAVMPGANENNGEDAGRVIAHCKLLHKATGALVLLIHHSGKDASRGARGWSGLRAAADVELNVVRNQVSNARCLSVTKLKDGEDSGLDFGFRLHPVDLDADDDGEDYSSCVVAPADYNPPKNDKPLDMAAYDAAVSVMSGGATAVAEVINGIASVFDISFTKAEKKFQALLASGALETEGNGFVRVPETEDLD